MSSVQKVIKYVAIGFAAFLSITIITAIGSAIFGIAGGFNSGETKNFSEIFEDIESIKVSSSIAQVDIVKGDVFQVTGENVPESMNIYVDNHTLIVKDNDKKWFNFTVGDTKAIVTITVPKDFVAESTHIDTGFGKVYVEFLNTKKLEINLGTGNIKGNDIKADQVDIEGGVGNISLDNVTFTDTKIEGGVGSINIQGSLTGYTKLECGVGSVDLSIVGNYDDYSFDIETGIGSIRINGDKVSDMKKTVNGATNELDVEGGVGSINIDIEE